jgi:hypothetical protein
MPAIIRSEQYFQDNILKQAKQFFNHSYHHSAKLFITSKIMRKHLKPPISHQVSIPPSQAQMPIPTSSPHYHLLAKSTSRIQYGVDHSAYMSTLAKDFGGAPGLYELWREHGLKVLFTYAFGASFVTVRNNLFMTKISINNVIVLSLARTI